ncbi:hypothetical protein WKR88_24675 [Trinickia caryophylli]|nr:hypothetical protein [Trinickia caryophylli]PMS13881.1 hypothetical protein C0Z17_03225 [Trinickia caryophylli]TRX14378.1 hypothetical protein FNF07_24185 [Trinickia caryophylli]WQE14215.1 hypothetical protein U0034_26380 [Trinickia caryophylli]GLU33278.1 hypothetical protein Busp01_31200 [Trinickia caryophylli]
MDISYETDALCHGALLGLLCGGIGVPALSYAFEELSGFPADDWKSAVGSVLVVAAIIIVPLLVKLKKAKRAVDLPVDSGRVVASLHGRLVGVAVGALFGIAILTR